MDFEVSQLRRDAQNLKTSECIGLFVREGQLLIKTTTFIVLHGRYRFSSALFDRYAKKLSRSETRKLRSTMKDTETRKSSEKRVRQYHGQPFFLQVSACPTVIPCIHKDGQGSAMTRRVPNVHEMKHTTGPNIELISRACRVSVTSSWTEGDLFAVIPGCKNRPRPCK